ncbi:hypothetical protein J2R99_000462 [Rhodopseudomonas julia]|uniref:Uncharacterized protein n=1 Tax=Rhodopseudomonas julia TaxID=200617 RepID=A0ABU0C276_9BRAD|nr:hypothetical protein [Rhodopseudomonas julia]MDQ0324613.1 hypothetical protein [Rhodopseudomonas julia]
MNAEVKVLQSGATIEITRQTLNDRCIRANLPACDDTVTVEASISRSYSGRSTCSTDPTPMLIAMQANRVEILKESFADTLGEGLQGFNRQTFLAEVARTEAVLPKLPARGQRAINALYAALADGNYPEAQRQAAEAAGFLREVEEERLSLAYSSITYVSGFRAIGLDALASENPLVATGSNPSFVVLSEKGRDVLELYQSARKIPAKPGVWDFPTSAKVATVEPATADDLHAQNTTEARGAIAPQSLDETDFFIDAMGRMVFN